MANEIILVGVKKYDFEKNKEMVKGITLHTQTPVDEKKGVGYETDRISISSTSSLYESICNDLNKGELSCGDIIDVSYNKYGKVTGVVKVS